MYLKLTSDTEQNHILYVLKTDLRHRTESYIICTENLPPTQNRIIYYMYLKLTSDTEQNHILYVLKTDL